MTTRVQEKSWLQGRIPVEGERMTVLEKAILRHAVFDPEDKVLDANVCSGKVAEYLLKHMECQVCGVSDRMEEIRATRTRMHGGDFVYAAIGDIPWRNESFDTVLLHPSEISQEALQAQLRECSRVLKPGGQLVLALRCVPAMLSRMGQLFTEGSGEEETCKLSQAQQLLDECDFEHLSRYRVGLSGQVLIAWKKNELL